MAAALPAEAAHPVASAEVLLAVAAQVNSEVHEEVCKRINEFPYIFLLKGMKGGAKVIIQPHRLEGIFVAKGQQDALCTKSFYPGESVYNEKRISIPVFL